MVVVVVGGGLGLFDSVVVCFLATTNQALGGNLDLHTSSQPAVLLDQQCSWPPELCQGKPSGADNLCQGRPQGAAKENLRVLPAPAREDLRVLPAPAREDLRVLPAPAREDLRVLPAPAKEDLRVLPSLSQGTTLSATKFYHKGRPEGFACWHSLSPLPYTPHRHAACKAKGPACSILCHLPLTTPLPSPSPSLNCQVAARSRLGRAATSLFREGEGEGKGRGARRKSLSTKIPAHLTKAISLPSL